MKKTAMTIQRGIQWSFILLVPVVLSSCSLFSSGFQSIGFGDDAIAEPVATLADLRPAVIPDLSKELPVVDIDRLVATYREVLDVTDDPDLRLRVMQRLAGLEMARGEQKLYEQESVGGQFNLAIDAYQRLLKNHPDHPDNDGLMYQLSKAYDLSGQSEQSMSILTQLVSQYPQSEHYVEAQFRRAEIFFAVPDYRSAEATYADVIIRGKESSHYQNALYMVGWSQFKRERYEASLKAFSEVLDLNVPADNNIESLPRGRRELTQDTFDIMSVVFSYLEGPQTIADVYQSLGERHYLPLVYDNLGAHYLKQERYRDSAGAYRAYIDRYPQSDQSPVFYASLIEAFVAAGFPDDVLLEKKNYVAHYGIYSNYWQQKQELSREYIRPFLEKYLPELARHFHAKAQSTMTSLNSGDGQDAQKKVSIGKKLKPADIAVLKQQATDDYLEAGNYYQEFIDTFPADNQVPEMQYLLAESRFEAGVYSEAIEAYEIVAYGYPDHKRGAVAGYAAIVAYGLILESVDPGEKSSGMTEQETWTRLKISSQLRFADTYQDDPRAMTVLAKSAEELLALKEYQQAIDAATRLTLQQKTPERSLRKTSWLVIGHSQFELENYPEAEKAYQQTLLILDGNDDGKSAIIDRLAASVYKQAERALALGDQSLAIDQFLRVAAVAPMSAISVTAQYDAADTLMAAERYTQAIAVMASFRNEYPDSPLSADIPAKLVVAYEQSGQWEGAANELTSIYESSTNEEVQQESLFQAAEFYEKAGENDLAILRYRTYANTYPGQYAAAMEARYKLSELYGETSQADKQRFWLRKIISVDRNAAEQRTDRSRYLAAYSSSVLADDAFQSFAKLRLTLPLKSSLKKKKKSLNTTLTAYQSLVDYGVEEFATLATYRIADVYHQLSRDLMNSERPGNLDALALEQYELLLEEQAFPFEEQAIDIHETNVQRSWQGVYDHWVKQSFIVLEGLMPARYAKEEKQLEYANEIY
ncbi:MAG: tetratricopeptide repeat protein [Oceanicoccus sp.]